MTLIITKIRESFDVRNRERVCLLEVIMKATLLIYTTKCVFKGIVAFKQNSCDLDINHRPLKHEPVQDICASICVKLY